MATENFVDVHYRTSKKAFVVDLYLGNRRQDGFDDKASDAVLDTFEPISFRSENGAFRLIAVRFCRV